jgi:hypothetical protein
MHAVGRMCCGHPRGWQVASLAERFLREDDFSQVKVSRVRHIVQTGRMHVSWRSRPEY